MKSFSTIYCVILLFITATSYSQVATDNYNQAALTDEIECEIKQFSTIIEIDTSKVYELLQASLEAKDTVMFFKLSLYASREYYYRLSKHQECIPFLKKSDSLLNNATSSAGSHNLHLGNHYLALGNKVDAMENYHKSLDWYRKYNPIRATLPLFNLANIYKESNDYEAALELHLEALSYSKLLPDDEYKKYNLVYDYVELSGLYQKLGKLDLAHEYIQKSLSTATEDRTKNVRLTAIEQAVSFYNAIDSNAYTQQLIEKGDAILSSSGQDARPHIKERFILNKSQFYLKTNQINMAVHPSKLDENNLVSEEDRLKYSIRYYEHVGDNNNELIAYKQLLSKKYDGEENYSKAISTVLENKEVIKELNSNSEQSLLNILTLKKRLIYLLVLLLGLLASVYFYKRRSNRLEKKIDQILSVNNFNIEKLKKYREASKQNKQYFTAVAHDIRSPMVKLKLINEQLQSGKIQNIDLLMTESETMNKEIDSMLKQLEHFLFRQKQELNSIESIDLYNLFEDCIKLVDPSILKPYNIEIMGKNTIECNRNSLKAIFKNCIENSMKYCDSNLIQFGLTVKNDDKNYIFSFVDNNTVETESNYLANDPDKSILESYGIGLEICKLSAERLGGWFVVDRKYKEGFKVDFSLGSATI